LFSNVTNDNNNNRKTKHLIHALASFVNDIDAIPLNLDDVWFVKKSMLFTLLFLNLSWILIDFKYMFATKFTLHLLKEN